METLPQSIIIVGGGVIGIEWASMLNDFGVDVTVVEYADRIIPTEDEDISKEMKKLLEKRGVTFRNGSEGAPETLVKTGDTVTISAEVGGETKDLLLIKSLFLSADKQMSKVSDSTTRKLKSKMAISKQDRHSRQKNTHIYAIGDVIGGLQLAHVASHEGIAAIEHIAGLKNEAIDYTKISSASMQALKLQASGSQKSKQKNKDLT